MPKKKEISPEDREVLLVLEILKNTLEVNLKTIQEAVDAVKDVKTSVKDSFDKVNTFLTKIQDAINRLEAKIAGGADAQPVVDELGTLKQEASDLSAVLVTKIAEAELTGV